MKCIFPFKREHGSKFIEEGFFSSGINRWSKECRHRYYEWFKLCEELNRYSIKLSQTLKISEDNRQQPLAIALFFKLLSFFEGSVILAQRCMVNETKVLLRTLMENLFILKAITKDESMANHYYEYHFFEKLRSLKQIKKYGSTKFYSGLNLDERIKELEEIRKQKKLKRLGVDDWADKAGLIEFYTTAYPVLSWTAHSNVIDVGQYIRGKSDDEIEGVEWHPQLEGIAELLLTAIECVVIGLRSVNELFNLGVEKEITVYSQRYQQLAKKLTTNEGD